MKKCNLRNKRNGENVSPCTFSVQRKSKKAIGEAVAYQHNNSPRIASVSAERGKE